MPPLKRGFFHVIIAIGFCASLWNLLSPPILIKKPTPIVGNPPDWG